MGQQGRLWLAVALSLVVWFAYDFLILRPFRQRQAQPTSMAEPSGTAPIEAVEADSDRLPSPPRASDDEPAATVPGLRTGVPDAPVVVDTPLVTARFTRQGARLASLRLKHHRSTVARDSPLLDLVRAGTTSALPLTLDLGGVYDGDIQYKIDQTTFEIGAGQEAVLRFRATTPGGQAIEKALRISGDAYLMGLEVKIDGLDSPGTIGLVVPAPTQVAGYSQTSEKGVALVSGKMVEHEPESMLAGPESVEQVAWAGFSGQYFGSVAMAAGKPATAVFWGHGEAPLVTIEAGVVAGVAGFDVFMGPKEQDDLVASGHDLDRLLDFGRFWFIALPTLKFLRWIERLVGNYGLAIIIVTVLIKLVTYPLTSTSMKSMRKMQEIQPQLERIRKRHKDEPAVLQREMMELYKRHNVNPLSGCLPMILQIPIFIGLYNALLLAIELRHAPFVGWINDLSAPDRLMVTPNLGIPVLTLLMGASMLAQQVMMPAQGDPNQRRMMMIMPVVFTFMFINFPAGLVLYWLVNNLLSIGQQYLALRPSAK